MIADARAEELAASLAVVRRRIEDACARAQRPPGDVTLIVVTKTWPADDVRRLAGLGVTDVGENRDQEAAPKHDACADLGLRWHFVGQLQSNKARSVVRYADVIHSIDRLPLVDAVQAAAARVGRSPVCLVQVGLDEQPGGMRGGVPPGDAPRLADAIAAAPDLILGGVMAVAPLGQDPRPAFERLGVVAQTLRSEHPGAGIVSAGMSEDLEAAVACGATHLRVGSAVLGGRALLR